MSDDYQAALRKKLGLVQDNSSKHADAESEDDESLCWGFVRGNRRALNIEFRRLQGAWPALEYAWLNFAAWCPVEAPFAPGVVAPAGSIALHYSNGYRVLICGRNMRPVHQKILEHQVKYLAEADRAMDHLSEEDAAIVTRIQLIEPSGRENSDD